MSSRADAVDVALCRRELLVPEQVRNLARRSASERRIGADHVAQVVNDRALDASGFAGGP